MQYCVITERCFANHNPYCKIIVIIIQLDTNNIFQKIKYRCFIEIEGSEVRKTALEVAYP